MLKVGQMQFEFKDKMNSAEGGDNGYQFLDYEDELTRSGFPENYAFIKLYTYLSLLCIVLLYYACVFDNVSLLIIYCCVLC